MPASRRLRGSLERARLHEQLIPRGRAAQAYGPLFVPGAFGDAQAAALQAARPVEQTRSPRLRRRLGEGATGTYLRFNARRFLRTHPPYIFRARDDMRMRRRGNSYPRGAGLATINDVAAAARVSIKTVSRVLNGEPHVRTELYDRVKNAVRQLGYQPNQAARRLAGGRSFFIAYIYNNPTPNYVAAVQSGAARRCRELGYHLVVEPVELAGSDRFATLQRLSKTLKPDGVFLIPPLSDDPDLLNELARLKIATARIAGVVPSHGWNLAMPEATAGRMVVDHLLALGHRRIAVVGPPDSHLSATARVDGYRDAMQAANAPVAPDWIERGELDFASGTEAAGRLLDLDDRPTAIFAANDEMALGAMAAARRRGLAVPHDLSVAGFDDTPPAGHLGHRSLRFGNHWKLWAGQPSIT